MKKRAQQLQQHIRLMALGAVVFPTIPADVFAQSDGVNQLEEVVATGIRGSLQNAANFKENAAGCCVVFN